MFSPLSVEWHHMCPLFLTHWGRVTHICVGELTIIVSDNGLASGRRQAIIWTNARKLLIGPLGTNFSDILIGIQTISSGKMQLKMSVKWSQFLSRPQCLYSFTFVVIIYDWIWTLCVITGLANHQGPVSISDKPFYRKISQRLDAARFVFKSARSLWNLTGTSAALLPGCLSKFKEMRWFKLPIS